MAFSHLGNGVTGERRCEGGGTRSKPDRPHGARCNAPWKRLILMARGAPLLLRAAQNIGLEGHHRLGSAGLGPIDEQQNVYIGLAAFNLGHI